MAGPRTRSQANMEEDASAQREGATSTPRAPPSLNVGTPRTAAQTDNTTPPRTPSRSQEIDELKQMVYDLSSQLNMVLNQRSNSPVRSLEEKLIKCLPKTKAPIYKGENLKLEEFFHSIERYYTLRGVDIHKQENNKWLGDAIREHLEGAALKYYSDTNDNRLLKPTWTEVKEQLKKRFTVEDQASKDRQELMKIRQGSNSLEKYINNFLELNTRTARESQLPEKWQIELFVMGLENKDVRAHVKLKHDDKLTTVIQSAREAEAIYTIRRTHPRMEKNQQVYQEKKKQKV